MILFISLNIVNTLAQVGLLTLSSLKKEYLDKPELYRLLTNVTEWRMNRLTQLGRTIFSLSSLARESYSLSILKRQLERASL